ncbi:MAG: hypothetical protein IT200_02850 [Thermoleophilia bacterium]|nr:hypothetical protein [Thermoleophilia bacterium]
MAQKTGAGAPPTTPSEASDDVQELLDAFATDAERLQKEAEQAANPIANSRSLSDEEVLDIAAGSAKVNDWVDGHPVTRTTPSYDKDKDEHTVWYVAKDAAGKEVTEAQVFINDQTGEIREVRTGPQVAWMMARGYEGSFGRAVNRPSIWLTLSALFLVPLISVRRLVSWRTLDLLVLLSFGFSLIWFNRGEIFTSVPLAYPPMAYLALRLAWVGYTRGRTPRRDVPEPASPRPPPRRPAFTGWAPTWVLVTALALALALRYGLNAFNSNVIDVGYAGVIGADRISHGLTPYGTFPSDCGNCDTYGPLTYMAYVPFELAQPWTGRWDALPAAHGAATTFDLLCVAGMLMLGWRLGGIRLGAALALAWAAFPFTAYALESNSNDALVPAMLIWGLFFAARPVLRGASLGLSVAAKFGAAILLPLWLRHPFARGGGPRGVLRYLAGLGIAAVATGWVLLLDGSDGVTKFWSRTIGYQLDRESPFSIWGQYPGLHPLQLGLTALFAVLAVSMLRWPRRLDPLSFTALSGLLMVGTQLTLTHWFYLYIPWFLPFVLVALVPRWPAATARLRAPAAEPGTPRRRNELPYPAAPVAGGV